MGTGKNSLPTAAFKEDTNVFSTEFREGLCMIKIFREGRGGDTFKTPSPLRTTFAFTHPLF